MKEHLEAGMWCCQAPLGYDNVTINGEKSTVINETGKILRKAFLWKANEGITMIEIVKQYRGKKPELQKGFEGVECITG